MSRSYKKHPVAKDSPKSSHSKKRIASRIVRRKANRSYDLGLYNNKKYRKSYESWDIHDYISRWTREEALEYYYEMMHRAEDAEPWSYAVDFIKKYPTPTIFLNKRWKKYMIRK